MNESQVILVAVVSTIASIIGLIFLIAFCAWCLKCFGLNKKKDEVDFSNYEALSTREKGDGGSEEERGDVKSLKKHSWRDRLKAKGITGGTGSPAITRKTIKFLMPKERRMTSENVQPGVQGQSAVNQQLGARPTSTQDSGGGETTKLQDILANLVTQQQAEDTGEGEDRHLGKIQFTVMYDIPEQTLVVRIMRARELTAKDFSGTSDPYVRVILLPDKKHKLETKVKKRNLNPVWNEVFCFEGFPYEKVQTRTLQLTVIDFDRFSRDDPIGEVMLTLGEMYLFEEKTYWRNLQPCSKSKGKKGELLISLCYQPTVGRVTIVIMKARELRAKDITGSSDPYVKLWLLYQGKKVVKKKTNVKMRTLSPVFNESFIFDVPVDKIRDTSILVTVMDYDRLSTNDMIGRFVLSPRSGPAEMQHWNEMLQKPRQQIAQWHILKD